MNCQKRHNRGSGSRYCNLNFQINFRQFFSYQFKFQSVHGLSANFTRQFKLRHFSADSKNVISPHFLPHNLLFDCRRLSLVKQFQTSFKLVSKGNVSGLLLKESKINTAAGAGSLKYLSLGIIRSRRCQSPVDTPRGEPFISFDEHFK